MTFIHIREREPNADELAAVMHLRAMAKTLDFDLAISNAEILGHVCDWIRQEEGEGRKYATTFAAARAMWPVIEPGLRAKREAIMKEKGKGKSGRR